MNQQQQKQQVYNICFYSKKCPWSAAFLKELYKTPLKNEFNGGFFCVDDYPRNKLPTWLKKVPTLLIRRDNDPDPLKIDKEVFNWISMKKLSMGNQGGRQGSEEDNLAPAYVPNEMSGIGNKYAFVSLIPGTNIEGALDLIDRNLDAQYQSKSFASSDFDIATAGPGTRTGSTIPGGGGGGGGSSVDRVGGMSQNKGDKLFDARMEQYISQRNVGVPQPAARR